jgi:hypothetical protein
MKACNAFRGAPDVDLQWTDDVVEIGMLPIGKHKIQFDVSLVAQRLNANGEEGAVEVVWRTAWVHEFEVAGEAVDVMRCALGPKDSQELEDQLSVGVVIEGERARFFASMGPDQTKFKGATVALRVEFRRGDKKIGDSRIWFSPAPNGIPYNFSPAKIDGEAGKAETWSLTDISIVLTGDREWALRDYESIQCWEGTMLLCQDRFRVVRR